MFWLSGRISKAIGVYGILLLSLASYTARFIIYANISNAYQALPAEFLRGLVFAVFWAGESSLSLSLNLKYLYTFGVLFRVEWCTRQLWCSLIIYHNINSIAYNHHTHNNHLLNIKTYKHTNTSTYIIYCLL